MFYSVGGGVEITFADADTLEWETRFIDTALAFDFPGNRYIITWMLHQILMYSYIDIIATGYNINTPVHPIISPPTG